MAAVLVTGKKETKIRRRIRAALMSLGGTSVYILCMINLQTFGICSFID
jgi:hypothetical protein